MAVLLKMSTLLHRVTVMVIIVATLGIKLEASPLSHVKDKSRNCGLNGFTCSDGTCIEASMQCDWYYDCNDQSDEHQHCKYTGFTCEDGQGLVADAWLCDGQSDCQDNSDEKQENCIKPKCDSSKCDNGTVCLDDSQVCDGVKDCQDGSDEEQEDCDSMRATCFRCDAGKRCIKSSWVCDNLADCEDFSDEMPETCGYDVNDRCWTGAFLCGHGYFCVPQKWRCDEEDDCGDNSDEVECDVESIWEPAYGWSSWSFWSECSTFCGPGMRTRYRTCHQLSSTCSGKEIASEECQLEECVVEKAAGCGTRKPQEGNIVKRVIGGKEADRGGWPWQAQLIYKYSSSQYGAVCGGTLVHNNIVLTAAHCFMGTMENEMLWEVHLGKHTINMDLVNHEKRANIKRIIKHSGYDPRTTRNDVAILILDKPIELDGQHINTACLDRELDMINKIPCFVTGWGLTEMGGTQAPNLQQAQVPIIHQKICSHQDVYSHMMTDGMICAGYLHGQVDACQGDSGGPLVCELDDGRWHVVGITSWGRGCALPLNPGVYTKVAYYQQWIDNLIFEHGVQPDN
ncbi:suppressor of tumorigenicity 14 protein homolog [Asterias rubens]|uniref:suppressor of tumorigenicity 14 protein homolog n=1 Tax=Asterias rubens TaxID=7604 RepID=UPI0014551ACC|nr:suppressor of tumorigenicity 14 protein homolog [Asterias rubens]